MFRLIVLIAFYSLFSLPSVAQALADKAAAPAPNNSDQHSQNQAHVRSAGMADSRVSVARLRVPRKARLLYESALEAWVKNASVEAEHRLDQALEVDPRFPEALTWYGGIQASRHEWGSAEQTLQAAIQSDPSYSPPYIILAGVYNTQSRFDEANDATHHALSAGANTWSVHYELARALIGKGEYENALAVTTAALRSKHGSLMHLAQAHALLGLRRYPQAATELSTYLHDEPSGDGSQDALDLLKLLQGFLAR